LSQDKRRSQVAIHEEIKVLWESRFTVSSEYDTCTIDKYIDTPKLLSNSSLHIEQLNVECKITLDD